MFRMINPVQDYAWGSTTALTDLFGWPPSEGPRAEVWMGTHPTAPSQVILGEHGPHDSLEAPTGEPVQTMGLDALLVAHPELADGPAGAAEPSADLPFLLKVLAAARPLSIQTHPDAERARTGFDAEEAAGVPRTAPERCYPDVRHKPELVVALDDFAALSGFRDADEAAEELEVLARLLRTDGVRTDPEAAAEHEGRGAPTDAAAAERAADAVGALADLLAAEDHRGALEQILRGRREEFVAAAERINRLFAPQAPAPRADIVGRPGGLAHATVDTLRRVTAAFPGDPGLLVTLLLRRVDLRPGEALFLPAGNMHAYLQGVGVEIMASSNNVLRGGLTSKHIDVDELLAVTDARPLPIPHCPPTEAGPGRRLYRPACREFALDRLDLPEAGETVPLNDEGPAVLLCTTGRVTLRREPPQDAAETAERPARPETPSGPESLTLHAGESAFLPATATHRLLSSGRGQAFLAMRGAQPQP